MQCHYTFMHENLMDMNHQFLHRRTTGKVAPRYLGSRAGDGWIEVDYSFSRPDQQQKPPLGEAGRYPEPCAVARRRRAT